LALNGTRRGSLTPPLRRNSNLKTQNSLIFQVLIDAGRIRLGIEQIVQSIVTPI
jgi:hypothetical protein